MELLGHYRSDQGITQVGDSEKEYDSFDSQKNTPSSQPGPQGFPSILKNHHERTPWSLEGRVLVSVRNPGQFQEPTWLHRVKQQQEMLKRRKLLWALYLMRDPLFTTYTRQKLDGTQKLLEPVPIVGLLTEKLIELLVGAQTQQALYLSSVLKFLQSIAS